MLDANLWAEFLLGYVLTVAIEMPVLLVGLSPRHAPGRKVFAGLWLTACTYPIVFLVLPALMQPLGSRVAYLLVAETFAPVAECALFFAAFGRNSQWRDGAAIVSANLLSFGLGEALRSLAQA